VGYGLAEEWLRLRHCAVILGFQFEVSQRICKVCKSNPRSISAYRLINAAVSMGRRNTKAEVYLRRSQKLNSFTSPESNGTLPWLGF
jgi:hypothetical protein